jgi:hypothetical protein
MGARWYLKALYGGPFSWKDWLWIITVVERIVWVLGFAASTNTSWTTCDPIHGLVLKQLVPVEE